IFTVTTFLENKSALVTGASGAIGGAICEELLKNGIKYLAVLDMNSQEPKILSDWKKTYPSVSIKYFQVDVTSHEELEKCFSEFTKTIPSLDIVVNCAGIFDESLYRKVIEVNLIGVIACTSLATEHMKINKGNEGSRIILNVSSAAGLIPFSTFPTYSASKHGVVAYTRAVAHGLRDLGIKFLNLCPGATESKLLDKNYINDYTAIASQEELDAKKQTMMALTQSPSVVSRAAVKIMQEGENGSTWVVKCGELTEAVLPEVRF
uniref:Alcohol dehydrogenase n=1 Tax=Phlebotomus papatasi TaxID=29031 RepID=A0A1B0GMT5_PHLPP